jgi:uncharacterized membrane protein YccC
MATPTPRSETGHALRVATAAVVCLVLVEWAHLEHGNLAVWTTHMVMAQYSFTAFQKGLERILGRGLGILVGLVLWTLCRNTPVLGVVLMLLALEVFFYVYFSGRFAYTWLNAGLYLAAIVGIALSHPERAVSEGLALFVAVVIGVVIADLVVWLSGAERDLSLKAGGSPLWPLRPSWLSHALMLTVTTALTQLATHLLDLPTSAALVSVMVLTVTPDLQGLLHKGELRVLGAFLGGIWGLGMFLILSRLPHLPLLAALLFLGMFLAAYLTRTGGTYSYAGLQMGLVLPLVVVVPPSDFGSLEGVFQRLEGIAAALGVSILVGGIWVLFTPRAKPPADQR